MPTFLQSIVQSLGSPVGVLLLDAGAKATVLLATATVATALLRRSSAAVRHRVWCLTFAALLLLPGLSALLPEWRLAVLPYSSPLAPREESQSLAPQADAIIVASHSPQLERSNAGEQLGFPLAEREDYYTAAPRANAQVQPAIADDVAPMAAWPQLSVAMLWFAGALAAIVPLLFGLLRTHFLRRKARPVDDTTWMTLFHELCRRLGLERRVTLCETDAALMPMTWGVLRPVVLLPSQAHAWNDRLRRIVLLHELAHVKRYDVGFQLLGRVACALYWFHPLAWYALRRLRIERELACDDCVVLAGERATDYAAELLQIARSYRPVYFAAAVAMAQRGNLEHRLRALFDRACSHLPVGPRTARLLLAGILILVTTIAAIRLAPRATAENADDKPRTAAGADRSAADTRSDGEDIHGIVLGPDGRPRAGAEVSLRLALFDADDAPLNSVASNAEGEFTMSFQWPPFDERLGAKPDVVVVATADGTAPDWKYLRQDQPSADIALRLREEKAIEGRILNAEGKPLAGVELRVETVVRYDEETMKLVLDDLAAGRNLLRTGHDYWSGALPNQPARVTTAADGRFRIGGLSANTVVKLHVRGAGIRETRLNATTAARDAVRGPVPSVEPPFGPRAAAVIYGARFDFVAEPGRRLEGSVRDGETGRPVAKAKVMIYQPTAAVGGGHEVSPGGGNDLLLADTDAAGRYVLDGCAKDSRLTLHVEPPADGPAYFQAALPVGDAPGLDKVVQDVALVRGTELRGRIVDSQTGQPLMASIHYAPLYLNVHVAALYERQADPRSHSSSKPDGSFRIVVAPGPGALAIGRPSGAFQDYVNVRVGYDDVVKLFEQSPEHRGLAQSPELKRGLPDSLPTQGRGPGFGFIGQGGARTVLISPDVTQPPEPVEVQLVRGRSLAGKVVDADGQPLSRVTAYLDNPGYSSQLLRGADFKLTALAPGDKREIAFYHAGRKLGAFLTVAADEPGPLTVRLAPSGVAVGRVLDKDGAPVEGMHVWLYRSGHFSAGELFAITDAGGRFRTDELIPGQPYELSRSGPGSISRLQLTREKRVLSVASGQTHDLGDLTISAEAAAAMKTQKKPTNESKKETPKEATRADRAERTIRGRIIDLEGRPVAGASVRIIGAWQPVAEDGKLDAWLKAAREAPDATQFIQTMRDLLREVPREAADTQATSTTKEGRFEVDAGGAERVVRLRIDGKDIESIVCFAVPRQLQPLRVAAHLPDVAAGMLNPGEDLELYGSEFERVAAPGCEVEGIVRDESTNQPLPGVTVLAERWSGDHEALFRATTDAQGRYRLSGISGRAKPTQVVAVAPRDDPYIGKGISAELQRPGDRATVNFNLARGVWLEGRVFDKVTGRGVQATVSYHAWRSNPYRKRWGEFSAATWKATRRYTDREGRFRLLVLPGPGLVAAESSGGYAWSIGAEKLGPVESIRDRTEPNLRLFGCNTVVGVDIPEQAEPFQCDIPLEPGRQRRGTVLGPDGKPLEGVHFVAGWKERWRGDQPLAGSNFTVEELVPGRKRTLVLVHEANKLVGSIEVSGDGDEPLEVRLEPWAGVRGRLVDEEGQPLSGLPLSTSDYVRQTKVGDDGRFELDRLVPGRKYELWAKYGEVSLCVAKDVTLKSGEVRDLGDVRLEEVAGTVIKARAKSNGNPKSPPSNNQKGAAAAVEGDAVVTLRGRVLAPDGKPAAGVDLYWLQLKTTGPQSPSEIWWQRRAVTDDAGRFQWSLENTDAKIGPSNRPPLIAYKPGFGLDGIALGRDEAGGELTLRLVKDQPIRGRLTDTEGRAVSGAQISVTSIQSSREGELGPFLNAWKQNWRDAAGKLDRELHLSRPLGPTLSTISDSEGRFELSGAGAERLVEVSVSAAGYMSERLRVVTREDFDAAFYNQSAAANSVPQMRLPGRLPRLFGPRFDQVLEAELVIRGHVFTGAERRPVTRGMVSSSGGGSANSVSAKIDDAGRFELRGARRSQDAYLHVSAPPADMLLSRTVKLALAPGQTTVDVDVELKAALVVEGRVFDRATGRGVKSGVRFVALPDNKSLDDPAYGDAKRTGTTMTDEEGHYRLLVIPGPGVIMAQLQAARPSAGIKAINRYRQASFSEEDGKRVPVAVDGDDRHFTVAGNTLEFLGNQNSLKVIDLAPDSQPAAIDLPFESGKTVKLAIEDGQGQPVTGAFVSGLADCWPHTFRVAEASCEIVGLGADRPRRVCILHPERHLAASLDLTGDETGPVTVRLAAPASVSGRALDPDGEPLADVIVRVNYIRRSASELYRFVNLEKTPPKTDGEGRFHVEDILPGERLMIGFKQGDAYFYLGDLTTEQRQLEAGQKVDVGEVKLKRVR